jgi:hypothetical protein
MRIEKGDIIKWTCGAGVLKGLVTAITLDLNAAKETCAWLMVKDVVDQNGAFKSSVCLNATDMNLKMLKVEVL